MAIRAGDSLACAPPASALNVPVVSGNVSFYNETDGVPIHPTPTIGMVGILDKVERLVTPWFKSSGDVVVMLGARARSWAAVNIYNGYNGLTRGTPPWIDLKMEQAVQRCCLRGDRSRILRSAHRYFRRRSSRCAGGVLHRRSGKPLGVRVQTHEMIRADALLFSESQSRIIVSLKEEDMGRLQEIGTRHNVPVQAIGVVGGTRFSIQPPVQVAGGGAQIDLVERADGETEMTIHCHPEQSEGSG